jgi:prephenate dehydrogenase
VVGGLGGMGLPLVELLKSYGLRVAALDLRDAAAEPLAPSLRTRLSDVRLYLTPASRATAADLQAIGLRVSEYSVVVIAVPVPEFEAAAALIAPQMASGSLLMDITSTKEIPIRLMLTHAPADVAVLGTHPLFGPSLVPRMGGWNVVLVETARCPRGSRWYSFIERFFSQQGAIITECDTGAHHDKMVAVTQLATHFFYISFARFLHHAAQGSGHGASTPEFVESLQRFATPSYSALLAFSSRVLGNPPLAAAIQGQEDGALVRDACLRAMSEVAQYLAPGHEAGTVEALRSIRESLGPARDSERP